ASAKRTIINRVMAVVRERPQVVYRNLNEPGLARSAHNAMIQWPAKKVRKNRQNLELHSGLPIAPGRWGFQTLTYALADARPPSAFRPLPASVSASRLRSADLAAQANPRAAPSQSAAWPNPLSLGTP